MHVPVDPSSRAVVFAIAVVSACFACPAPALAQAGPAPASLERNVYLGGAQVRPEAAVPGDFTAAGAKVVVDHPVGGDATLAGGSVDVRAPVADDVRAMGGDVSIESTVGGELFASGGSVTLTTGASVAGRAIVYASSVTIDGVVGGGLRATGGRIVVNGEVRGDARLSGETIALGPKAKILGGLVYASGGELTRAEGATVMGPVTREQEPGGAQGRERGWEASVQVPGWTGFLLSFLALLAAGALFLLLVPQYGRAAARRISAAPWLALAIGFGTVVALPVLAALLFVTLLGIPIGIALMALYPVLLLAGFVVGVLFVGQRLAAVRHAGDAAGYIVTAGHFAAALLLVLLLALVPFVGGSLVAVLSLMGVGSCILELHARRRGPGDPGLRSASPRSRAAAAS